MINAREKPKFLRIIMAVSVILLIAAVVRNVNSMHCLANNHQDTLYEYTINSDRIEITDLWTPTRAKTDASSAYNTKINYIRIMAPNNVDYTDGAHQGCAIGQAKYLYNLIYERGQRSTYFLFEPGNGHHAYIHFLWSPDSV